MSRKIIDIVVNYRCQGSVDGLNLLISDYKEKFPEATNFCIYPSESRDEEGEYCDIRLCCERPETDEEMEKRIQRQKEWLESNKRSRKEQYEKLKKEFENEATN